MDIYKRIGIVCAHIPSGKVVTYGQIAMLCEKPKNARQVGYALKNGLAGEQIPAYKVVNAQGVLSGAAYFETNDMQKMLLMEDGIDVVWSEGVWRVDLKKYGWKNTMEDVELFQRLFHGEHDEINL